MMQSRVGSHWLQGMLNKHEDIFCAGEIFGNAKKDQRLLLSDFVGEKRAVRAVGFRLAPQFIKTSVDTFRGWLLDIDPATKVIHLQRRNRVQACVSLMRAQALKTHCPQLREAWSPTKKDNCTMGAIDLDPDALLKHIQRREVLDSADREFVNQLYQFPRLDVFYEDLMRDKFGGLSRIAGFLGISDEFSGKSEFTKVTSSRIQDAVSNHQHVLEVLRRRSPIYAHMLNATNPALFVPAESVVS
jgi:hypothetical protein